MPVDLLPSTPSCHRHKSQFCLAAQTSKLPHGKAAPNLEEAFYNFQPFHYGIKLPVPLHYGYEQLNSGSEVLFSQCSQEHEDFSVIMDRRMNCRGAAGSQKRRVF
ncbi:hypothetical protein VULLAG_LOCUS8358 [Vulpes lagopus]